MNTLNGKRWLTYSISVWDIIKSKNEIAISHPAMFPVELCNRLIEIFTIPGDTVLDPFLGCGSTLISAKELARSGYGFEINNVYTDVAKKRINKITWGSTLKSSLKNKQTKLNISERIKTEKKYSDLKIEIPPTGDIIIFEKSCQNILDHINENSIDFVLTSPPYWDILRQKRTADYKEIRPYSDDIKDFGNIESYNVFISELGKIFKKIFKVLKPKKFCAVVVMDIRKKDRFYPFHFDLAKELTKNKFKFEDIIIWNRVREYNNLRALGYPSVFRVNKVHEYILIFSKN